MLCITRTKRRKLCEETVETPVETTAIFAKKAILTCIYMIHTQCVETCLKSGLRVPYLFEILCIKGLTSGLKAQGRRALRPVVLVELQLLACNNLKGDRRNDVVAQTNRSFVVTNNLDGARDFDLALVDVAKTSSRNSFCDVCWLN